MQEKCSEMQSFLQFKSDLGLRILCFTELMVE